MRTPEGLGYKARARVRTRMVTLRAWRSTSLHTQQVQVWIQIQIHRVNVKFLIKAQDQFQEESEERMGRLNVDAHARIVNMWRAKFKVKEIVERLAEGVEVGYTAIYNLLSKFKKTELIGDLTRRPHSRRLNKEEYRFIKELMAENTDLTSRQLYAALKEAYPTLEMSLSTVNRARQHLGWTAKRTRYCQLISEINKEKRMEWYSVNADDLDMEFVIWTDECFVQLESYHKMTYLLQGRIIYSANKIKGRSVPLHSFPCKMPKFA